MKFPKHFENDYEANLNICKGSDSLDLYCGAFGAVSSVTLPLVVYDVNSLTVHITHFCLYFRHPADFCKLIKQIKVSFLSSRSTINILMTR